MRLHLVDRNPEIVRAWKKAFAADPEIDISAGDILTAATICVVSPANSYGVMDGGIDARYTEFFGLRPQTELQQYIATKGKLLVGESALVRTGHERIPYMICAPTMRTPGPVPKVNAFYAMAAVLDAVARSHELIPDVYCPGLCTGVGRVSAVDAASEMARAYARWVAKGGA